MSSEPWFDPTNLLSELSAGRFSRLFNSLLESAYGLEPTVLKGSEYYTAYLPAVAEKYVSRLVSRLAHESHPMWGDFPVEQRGHWLFVYPSFPSHILTDKSLSSVLHDVLSEATDACLETLTEQTTSKPGRYIDFPDDPIFCYVVTNVHYEYLHTNAAQQIFAEVFKSTRDRYSSILNLVALGYGTPQTILSMDSLRAPASAFIHEFLASILGDPSELIVIVREGKIHISPYGSYSSRIANTYGRKPSSKTSLSLHSPAPALTLTPTCLLNCSFLADQLTELEEILSAKTVREKAIQDFLIRHPDVLRLFKPYSRIHPHVHLRDGKGTTLIPDFMCQIEDDQIWEIIELKRPSAIQLDGLIAERISSEIAHGVKQLLKYGSFFEHNQNRGRLRDHYDGIDCFEPLLTLVIGRELPLQKRWQWSHMKAHWPDVNIISYDFMIQECRNTLNKIIGLHSSHNDNNGPI